MRLNPLDNPAEHERERVSKDASNTEHERVKEEGNRLVGGVNFFFVLHHRQVIARPSKETIGRKFVYFVFLHY